jgi:hypothetical protein
MRALNVEDKSDAPTRKVVTDREWEYRDMPYVLDREDSFEAPCGDSGFGCGFSAAAFAGFK